MALDQTNPFASQKFNLGGVPQQVTSQGTTDPQQQMMQQMFQAMMQMDAQKQEGRLQAQREAIGSGDVVGEANKRAATVGSAWASGGAFADQPKLSPEAKLASQGNSAMNQWGVLGQVHGVNGEALGRLNDITQQNRMGQQPVGQVIGNPVATSWSPPPIPQPELDALRSGQGFQKPIQTGLPGDQMFKDANWMQVSGRPTPKRRGSSFGM